MGKFKKAILLGGMGLSVLGLVALILFYYLAPAFLEGFLKSQVEGIGLPNARVSVSRLTPRAVEMERLSFGPLESPVFEIARIEASSSPSKILQRKLEGIVVTGLKAHLHWDGNKLVVAGLEDLLSRAGGEVEGTSSLAGLWGQVEKFQIRASTLTLHAPGQEISLFLEGGLASESDATRRFSLSAIVVGSKITSTGKSDFARARVNLNFRVSSDSHIRDIHSTIHISDLFIQNNHLSLPLEITLSGETMENLSFSIAPFQSPDPYPLAFSQAEGNIKNLPRDPQISGQFSASADERLLSSLFPDGRLKAKGVYPITGNYSLVPAKEGWTWKCEVSGDEAWNLAHRQGDVSMGKVEAKIVLEGTTNRATGQINLSLSQTASRGKDGGMIIKKISAESRLDFSGDEGLRGEGAVSIQGADFTFTNGGSVEGLDIFLPLAFPLEEDKKREGKFTIKSIKTKDLALRGIKGAIKQKSQEPNTGAPPEIAAGAMDSSIALQLSGEALLPLGPEGNEGRPPVAALPIRYSGDGRWDVDGGLNLHFEIPKTKFPDKVALGTLHSGLSGWKFQGGISASGDLSLAHGAWKSGGTLELENAEMHSEKPKVSATGINSKLIFQDLLNLLTPPDQRLQFEKLIWGEIPFTGGELHFRLEGARSFFLEKGEFVWCEGKVFANAVRIDLDADDVTLLLYCDKVNLSRMLNFMVRDISAEGKGRISGIIPLQISKGKVTFKEGFLYSTPGDAGEIKIKETEVISGGNVLLEEAIKDFSYDWVKVRLDSRGENLNMVVNLNGTPNRKLPLALDPETKSFRRDEKGEAGVNLQGLHLELRFNEIPLDELLRKGKYLKGLFQ